MTVLSPEQATSDLAVGRVPQLENRAAEAAHVADRLAVVVGVPDPDAVVLAAGGNSLAVGRERHGVNRLRRGPGM